MTAERRTDRPQDDVVGASPAAARDGVPDLRTSGSAHRGPGDLVLGRRGALAALLAAGSAVAGCARIPTSGPVVGRADVAVEPPPQVFARPPQAGAGPIEIVDGFVRAAAIGDVVTARQYLAGSSVSWDPEVEVTLYTSSALSVLAGPGAASDSPPTGAARATPSASADPGNGSRSQIVLRLDGVVATIDKDGRMGLLDEPQRRRRFFGLVVRDGQWKIDRLDDGVPVSFGQFSFSASFTAWPIWFPDRTGRWLLPDVRYVRQSAFQQTPTQTQVVNAVLDGPAAWLGAAVEPLSKAQRLKVSSVPLSPTGLATVDLTEEFLALDENEQQVLRAQLGESLRDLRGTYLRGTAAVSSVEITVNEQRLRAVAQGTGGDQGGGLSPARLPRRADLARAGSKYVAVDEKARIVTGQGSVVKVVDGIDLEGGARPAMSYTEAGRTYGLVVTGKDPTRRTLKVAEPGVPAVDVLTAADLTTPSFDNSGWVWTVPRNPVGRAVSGLLVGGDVRRVSVEAPWLTSGQVVALRVSREGARAALLVDDLAANGRRSTTLLLAAVERKPSGEPVALGTPVRLMPDLVRASDVAWLDHVTVVVVGSRRTSERALLVQPWRVDVGGDPGDNGIRGTAALGAILVGADGKPVTTAAQWERLGLDVAPSLAVGDDLASVYVATSRAGFFHYRAVGAWERVRVNALRPAFPG